MDVELNLPLQETDRLILRPIQLSDASDMFEIVSQDIVSEYMLFSPHKTIEETITIINKMMKNSESGKPSMMAIVLKENNKMIGGISHTSYNQRFNTSDIAYYLSPNYWRKGIMTEALNIMIKLAFEHLNVNRLQVTHMLDNISSQALILKCGFVYEGLMRSAVLNHKGEVKDLKLYSITKSEYIKERRRWDTNI